MYRAKCCGSICIKEKLKHEEARCLPYGRTGLLLGLTVLRYIGGNVLQHTQPGTGEGVR